jgi:integrase/recombinase XerD
MTIRPSKVNITASIKLAGGWRFCKVPSGANHKLKPGFVLVAGQEVEAPDPKPYYLDFLQNGQRKRIAAGRTAVEAQAAADQQTGLLTAHKTAADAGIILPETTPKPGSRLLKEAVDTYLLEIEAHKKPKTLAAYRTALTYFKESCRKTTLEELQRTDMLAFVAYLRKGAGPAKKVQSARSMANKFENVMTFLKWADIRIKLTKHDWPKYTEEEVEIYSPEELTAFFSSCTETEKVWFKFFRFTGMREQEVMHVSWPDIDFERGVVTVRENKLFEWTPKANKEREIAVPSELLTLLKTFKSKRDTKCGLVFPTAGCKPKQNFLDECKAIAERAGLNGDDFWLHKFRATRITEWARNLDTDSSMLMAGHEDYESHKRYLGKQKIDVLQGKIERMNAEGV